MTKIYDSFRSSKT